MIRAVLFGRGRECGIVYTVVHYYLNYFHYLNLNYLYWNWYWERGREQVGGKLAIYAYVIHRLGSDFVPAVSLALRVIHILSVDILCYLSH